MSEGVKLLILAASLAVLLASFGIGYWGEFDTPAEARAARNQLPTFLSRLEPFEIPVKDAVAKARAGQ